MVNTPGGCLEGGDAPLQGVQGLCLLWADKTLNLQGQGVNIGAYLKSWRLIVSLNIDMNYYILTIPRTDIYLVKVSANLKCWRLIGAGMVNLVSLNIISQWEKTKN